MSDTEVENIKNADGEAPPPPKTPKKRAAPKGDNESSAKKVKTPINKATRIPTSIEELTPQDRMMMKMRDVRFSLLVQVTVLY